MKEEGNALFNDALNTFYVRFYGVGHMVKHHSDSERGNALPPIRGLLFPIDKGFYWPHPTDMIIHTTALITPTVERCFTRDTKIHYRVHYLRIRDVASWYDGSSDRSLMVDR